jgi:xylan 1,4-beta-xylosidase
VAADEIPKPSLNVFRALHKLGDERIRVDSDSALATTSSNHRLALALWDYAPPDGIGAHYTMPTGPAGPSKAFTVTIEHVPANAAVEIWRVDDDHGNVIKAFNAMGRPADLTPQQIAQLRSAGAMAAPEHTHLRSGKLELTVPPHGLAVVLIGP